MQGFRDILVDRIRLVLAGREAEIATPFEAMPWRPMLPPKFDPGYAKEFEEFKRSKLKQFERSLSREQREGWKRVMEDDKRLRKQREARFLEKAKQASNPRLRSFVGEYNKGLFPNSGDTAMGLG
jgi:hypothetical protein